MFVNKLAGFAPDLAKLRRILSASWKPQLEQAPYAYFLSG
jgi:hypothetical protein